MRRAFPCILLNSLYLIAIVNYDITRREGNGDIYNGFPFWFYAVCLPVLFVAPVAYQCFIFSRSRFVKLGLIANAVWFMVSAIPLSLSLAMSLAHGAALTSEALPMFFYRHAFALLVISTCFFVAGIVISLELPWRIKDAVAGLVYAAFLCVAIFGHGIWSLAL